MMYKISIIGSGFVGQTVGKGFSKLGYEVIFYDIDKVKIKKLREFGYKSTLNLEDAIKNSELSFICVPTPTKNGKMDPSFIIDVTRKIGRILRDKKEYHTLVVKSTVLPTTTEKIVIPILEKNSRKKVDDEIGVCVNPEFLTEISHSWTKNEKYKRNFFQTDRIVIGEIRPNSFSGDLLEELYKPLEKPIFRVTLREAEAIKYLSNNFLALKISYWNEMYIILKDFGIDTKKIAPIVGLDPRIGKYGTVHGKAFGGKCLPKDLHAFITWIEENIRKKPKILKAVKEINDFMKEYYGVRE